MSYILDALKKSQRQRELGSVPRLTTEQRPVSRTRSGLLSWTVAGVALAVAGALAMLYWPNSRTVPQADMRAAGSGVADPLATSVDQRQPAPGSFVPSEVEQAGGGQEVVSAVPVTRSPAVAPEEAPGELSTGPEAAGGFATSKADVVGAPPDERVAAPGGTAPVAQTPEEGGSAQSVPLLSELAYAAQSSIPAQSLNVHVYAPTPKERFVFLNMHKHREGERTRDGVLVEEITPEGVVLRYGPHRFRLVY